VRLMEHVPYFGYSKYTNLNTTAWINQHFFWKHLLSDPANSEKPFDGLDKLILLSWVHNQFSDSEDQPFVLSYWDLRLPNIIIDNEDNLLAIIDWDGVTAAPLKLSAISLAESLYPEGREIYGHELDHNLDELFQNELRRIEYEKSSSTTTEWSEMFFHSLKHRFLFDILRRGRNLLELRRVYPDLFAESLRHPNLSLAGSYWREFAAEFFLDKNRTIPDDPEFIKIQEGLGICGQSNFERWFRKLKRNVLKDWNLFVDKYWKFGVDK
jgi:hypothetical protein